MCPPLRNASERLLKDAPVQDLSRLALLTRSFGLSKTLFLFFFHSLFKLLLWAFKFRSGQFNYASGLLSPIQPLENSLLVLSRDVCLFLSLRLSPSLFLSLTFSFYFSIVQFMKLQRHVFYMLFFACPLCHFIASFSASDVCGRETLFDMKQDVESLGRPTSSIASLVLNQ